MRNEPWVWRPKVGDAGTSGAGAVPLRSTQMMGQLVLRVNMTNRIRALNVLVHPAGNKKTQVRGGVGYSPNIVKCNKIHNFINSPTPPPFHTSKGKNLSTLDIL